MAIKKITPMAATVTDAKHVLRELRLLRYMGRHQNVRVRGARRRRRRRGGGAHGPPRGPRAVAQIISLKSVCVRERADELYIIMDLMDTDLHRIIQSSQSLTDAHHKHFMYQLLRGLRFLHVNGILHRDLKPSNLLVTKNCDLRISDFGLSRAMPEEGEAEQHMTEHVVTRWYRPPELMLNADGVYASSVDMWSVGCIFAELLGRKPLFPGKNFMHQARSRWWRGG